MKIMLVGGSFDGEIDLPDSTTVAQLPDVLVCRSTLDFPHNNIEMRREEYKLHDPRSTPAIYKH